MYNINNLNCAVYFFIIINLIIYYLKPSFLFKNGNFKKLGINQSETLLPCWLFTLLLSILIYFLLTIRSGDYIK